MRDEKLILTLHRIGRPSPDAVLRGLFTSVGVLKFQVRLLRALGFNFATLRDAMIGRPGRTAVLTFDDGYADNMDALSVLRKMDVPATIFVVTGDVGSRNVVWEEAGDKTPADMLSWEDLEAMIQNGWEIGGHAEEHILLAERTAEEQRSSITNCRRAIHNRLGVPMMSFGYPYGSYSETTLEILKELGVRFAVTAKKPGVGELDCGRDLEMKRLPVCGWAWHHYLRILLRTLGAVGIAGLIGAILPPAEIASPIPLRSDDHFQTEGQFSD